MKWASRGAADLFIPLEAYGGDRTGIDEIEQSSILIAQESEALRITAPALKQILLYNTAGVLVEGYIAEGESLLTKALLTGIYVLSITTAEGTTIRKAMVK